MQASPGSVTSAAFAELERVTRDIESGLSAFRRYDKINYLMLMMVDPDVLYVDEGTILTSAGSAAGIDLWLHLVRRDFGPARANEVARQMDARQDEAAAMGQELRHAALCLLLQHDVVAAAHLVEVAGQVEGHHRLAAAAIGGAVS